MAGCVACLRDGCGNYRLRGDGVVMLQLYRKSALAFAGEALYSDTARLVSKVAMLRIAVVYAAVLTRTLPKPGDGLR